MRLLVKKYRAYGAVAFFMQALTIASFVLANEPSSNAQKIYAGLGSAFVAFASASVAFNSNLNHIEKQLIIYQNPLEYIERNHFIRDTIIFNWKARTLCRQAAAGILICGACHYALNAVRPNNLEKSKNIV